MRIGRLHLSLGRRQEERQSNLTVDQWLSLFNFGGLQYPFMQSGTISNRQEEIPDTFSAYVGQVYKANGVVFACEAFRQRLFSEARFKFRQLNQGTPGDLFGTQALEILERPWPNARTGDLLTRALLDADLAGNFYAVRRGDRLIRLQPHWVTIVLDGDAPFEPQLAGYLYHPRGPGGSDPIPIRTEEMVHFAPLPDPAARYRGMSWLTPVVTEIMGDNAANSHKLKFFEQGATLGTVVTLSEELNPEAFETWVQKFRQSREGVENAYKTLFLAGGADVKVIGTDLKQLEFAETQGWGEARICAAAGLPAPLAGIVKGLDASTYNNFGQARRLFADGTLRPLWRMMAEALENVVPIPPGSQLWFDDHDIAFLQEDLKDGAEVQESKSRQIRALTDGGFVPDSVVKAVQSDDFSLLRWSGMLSVQLQEPGTQQQNGAKVNGVAQLELPAET